MPEAPPNSGVDQWMVWRWASSTLYHPALSSPAHWQCLHHVGCAGCVEWGQRNVVSLVKARLHPLCQQKRYRCSSGRSLGPAEHQCWEHYCRERKERCYYRSDTKNHLCFAKMYAVIKLTHIHLVRKKFGWEGSRAPSSEAWTMTVYSSTAQGSSEGQDIGWVMSEGGQTLNNPSVAGQIENMVQKFYN